MMTTQHSRRSSWKNVEGKILQSAAAGPDGIQTETDQDVTFLLRDALTPTRLPLWLLKRMFPGFSD